MKRSLIVGFSLALAAALALILVPNTPLLPVKIFAGVLLPAFTALFGVLGKVKSESGVPTPIGQTQVILLILAASLNAAIVFVEDVQKRKATDQTITRLESISDGLSQNLAQSKQIVSLSTEAINEATGAGTFCYFSAVPNMGTGNPGNPVTYPLTVWVRGKYPMRNVVASINEAGSTDPTDPVTGLRSIPLGDGTLLPGVHPVNENFRIRLGKHVIAIWSRTGLLTESIELRMSNGQLVQTGDVWGDGKKLYEFPPPDKKAQ